MKITQVSKGVRKVGIIWGCFRLWFLEKLWLWFCWFIFLKSIVPKKLPEPVKACVAYAKLFFQ